MYFQLRQTPVMGGLYDTINPALGPKINWMSGQPHAAPIPSRLEIRLSDTFGTRLADIFDTGVLVMSSPLVETLKHAGVDNLDTYEAVLVDPNRGLRFTGYQAVQIIGRLSVADMEASEAYDPMGLGQMVSFRKLVVDERAARGLLMFRLHESASTILIHEQVRNEIEKSSWQFVTTCPPGEKPVPLNLDET
jgi:hypothetical protein